MGGRADSRTPTPAMPSKTQASDGERSQMSDDKRNHLSQGEQNDMLSSPQALNVKTNAASQNVQRNSPPTESPPPKVSRIGIAPQNDARPRSISEVQPPTAHPSNISAIPHASITPPSHTTTPKRGLFSKLTTFKLPFAAPVLNSPTSSVTGLSPVTADGPSTALLRRATVSGAAPASATTAAAAAKSKNRPRKGSLRQAVLLGPSVWNRSERKQTETTGSPSSSPITPKTDTAPPLQPLPYATPVTEDGEKTPLASADLARLSSSPELPKPTHESTDSEDLPLHLGNESRASFLTTTTTTTSDDASGTDPSESLPLTQIDGMLSSKSTLKSSAHDAFYAAAAAAATSVHRRPSRRATSPLATTVTMHVDALPSPAPIVGVSADWDDTETARWGWIVLACTWIIFVMGMGSCLGVWSWAWDVGETPYAPPELEDDPTLPITGYYPALIILTGVMAWVWVLVAWVGMKYFRHAKIAGED